MNKKKICEWCNEKIKNAHHLQKYHKKCWREYRKEYQKEYDKNKYQKNKEHYKKCWKEYYQKNKDKIKKSRRKYQKEYMKDWRKKYPKKIKAHNEAYRKIKIPIGQLCQICNINPAVEKHHPDYSKPLVVQFLCHKCHLSLRYLEGKDG